MTASAENLIDGLNDVLSPNDAQDVQDALDVYSVEIGELKDTLERLEEASKESGKNDLSLVTTEVTQRSSTLSAI